jgi:L-threonylcarbamoyladenylate synthase
MFTKVGKEEIIDECAALIRAGEIVAFPTETVYGLGGDALNESAVKKIYEAKNRPADNPFIVHVPSIDEVEKAAYLTDDAAKLFEAFTPGPLTIVLRKKECVPYCVTAGLDTVGIRIPSHPLAQEFLRKCGTPVAAPSANVSKRVSPTSAQYVYEDMNGKIPAIIDGGSCQVGIESTVISLAGDDPVVLRPGGVTLEMLAPYLPKIHNHTGKVTVAPAPGMKYKHYSPLVPCVLYASADSACAEYDIRKREGKNPLVLALESDCRIFAERGVKCVSLGKDGREFAHNIFDYLRKYEKTNGYLIVQALGKNGIEASIMNRLMKSSGGIIV